MANDSYTQQALASDTFFRQRVRSQLSTVAWQVQNEDPATPNHDARTRYARQVVRSLDAELSVILPSFVMRPNVFTANTTYVFDWHFAVGQVVSAVTDAAIAAQLSADWDSMAAGAGYVAPPVGPPTAMAAIAPPPPPYNL